jgi:hypothetical protein
MARNNLISVLRLFDLGKTSGSRAFVGNLLEKSCKQRYQNIFSNIPAGANTDKAKKEIPRNAFQSGYHLRIHENSQKPLHLAGR